MRPGRALSLLTLLTVMLGLLTLPQAAVGQTEAAPIVGQAIAYALSPAVRDLPAAPPAVFDAGTIPSRINPLAGGAGELGRNRSAAPTDPLIGPPSEAPTTPSPRLRFPGLKNPFACGGCSPPDTVGDAGPDHYIQMVNVTKVAIFDKAGRVLRMPFDLGDLWPSGTCASNTGDPIVLYDEMADRWLLSQFAFPSHMCVAISQTGDPLGSYHIYTFNVGSFPDYFKFGVWPDAYYMGANEGSYTAYAFDRTKMLAGDSSATFVKFTGEDNFLLPSDLDGPTPPPAGTPGYFYTFKDNSFHGGQDRIELFALDVNFVNPNQSTFDLIETFPIAPYVYTVCGFFNFNCARQRGTSQRIDVVSEWPMHRFPYRNFGTHETLLGNFAIGGGLGDVGSAIRWFELRDSGGGWTVHQEGTHDPGDGHDRFMGSIAMDSAGNIALGYSVSSSSLYPGVRYAVRAPNDPPGTLRREAVLQSGHGSQTGSNRWGDYSAMSVDPADDCSFWYTNELYAVSASTRWRTVIGMFRIPGC
jgi:hypothetical protein